MERLKNAVLFFHIFTILFCVVCLLSYENWLVGWRSKMYFQVEPYKEILILTTIFSIFLETKYSKMLSIFLGLLAYISLVHVCGVIKTW